MMTANPIQTYWIKKQLINLKMVEKILLKQSGIRGKLSSIDHKKQLYLKQTHCKRKRVFTVEVKAHKREGQLKLRLVHN